MFTDLAPEEPTANTPHAVRDTYMKWLNDHTTMHFIMRAAINNELNHKFKDVQSEKMIQLLNEFFSTPKDAERNKISCIVFNARMRGALVTDYVLYMIEQMNA